MRINDSDTPSRDGGGASDRFRHGRDIATVTAEFDVIDNEQAVRVAELLFASDDVLTVRVGGPGEHSVYRVDVPRDSHDVRSLATLPASDAAEQLDLGLSFVRIGISSGGLGDPEGSSPSAYVVPRACKHNRSTPRIDRRSKGNGE